MIVRDLQIIVACIELSGDELFVVPRGVEHCPVAGEDVEFMIIGPGITSAESK